MHRESDQPQLHTEMSLGGESETRMLVSCRTHRMDDGAELRGRGFLGSMYGVKVFQYRWMWELVATYQFIQRPTEKHGPGDGDGLA